MLGMALAISACEKTQLDELRKTEFYDPATSANVRFLHVYPWLTPAVTTTNPSLASGQHFYIYRDTFKLNGNPISYGGNWPGPSVYSLQPVGSFDFRIVLARQVANLPRPSAGDTLVVKRMDLAAGKYYSAFICDTFNNRDLWVIEDKIDPVYDTMCSIRLVHLLIHNRDTISIFSRRENREIASNVTYKTASEFVKMRVYSTADTFDIIRRGPGSNPYNTTGTGRNNWITGFVGTPGRYYTLIARGNSRVANRGASLGFYINL